MTTFAEAPTGSGRRRSLLLRLYPEAWQARYGAEFADLLEARPPALRDRLDIVAGAIDARLHPQVVGAPIERAVTAADRFLALAAVAVGALLGTWTTIVALAAPRWGSQVAIPVDVVGFAYGAGLLGTILGIGVFLGLLYRYASLVTTAGALGVFASAGGFAVGILASAGFPAIVLLVVGSVAMAPWLARSIGSWRIAIALAGATIALFAAMAGFEATGGQNTLLLLFLLPYGPAWMLLGRALLRGGPRPSLEPVLA